MRVIFESSEGQSRVHARLTNIDYVHLATFFLEEQMQLTMVIVSYATEDKLGAKIV